MEKTKPNLARFLKLPNPGLRAYLSHVVEGNPEDYRPPFWKGQSRETVLNRWADRLDSLRVDVVMPGLMRFENELRTKVGPLSVQAPLSDRIESIEHYYTLVKAKSKPIEPKALELAWKSMARAGGVRLRGLAKVAENMRLSTNSGTPYFTKRRRVLAETELGLDFADPSILRTTDITYNMAAILGWRGQEGGPEKDDVKQRVVWMMPLSVNILEAMFYQPAVEAWQKNNVNSAYTSMRAVEEKITRLFDTKGDDYVVVTDFSKFDQHFNSDLQDAASFLEKRMICYSHGFDKASYWIEDVFPYKFRVPLICSQDVMYTGLHGMASGSTGTNFDECCAHTAMQHECAMLNGATLNPFSNAYGDDGYLSFKGIDVDKVISAYTSHGQEMNPEKQYVDKHSAVYLRRYFHDSYRDDKGIMLGVYSTFRALGRLLGQERYYDPEIWSKELVELRALSILENCKWHPAFHPFIDFVMSGDRYRLGLDIPGFLDTLGTYVKKASEEIPDFMGFTKTLQGDTASGIEQWEVVKYLKSLR